MKNVNKKMNQKVKRQWVNLIANKNTKMTKYSLTDKTNTRFCVLGLLCILYQKDTKDGTWEQSDFGDIRFKTKNEKYPSALHLSEDVIRWAGLKEGNLSCTFINKKGFESCLSQMNDYGATRAKLIETIKENF